MLVLRTSDLSPFGRKARMAADVLGLSDRVKVEPADTRDPDDPLRVQNPLGKVPVLILEDGSTLFDSRVILEYFDWLAGGGRILPPMGRARFDVLRLQALADGALDAAVLQVYESRYRPAEMKVQSWLDMQAGKMNRALDALEAEPPPVAKEPDAGAITLACALSWLDRRFPAWREGRPALVRWLEDFAATVPAYARTMPPPT